MQIIMGRKGRREARKKRVHSRWLIGGWKKFFLFQEKKIYCIYPKILPFYHDTFLIASFLECFLHTVHRVSRPNTSINHFNEKFKSSILGNPVLIDHLPLNISPQRQLGIKKISCCVMKFNPFTHNVLDLFYGYILTIPPSQKSDHSRILWTLSSSVPNKSRK